jgi:hypothetical protein
MSRAFRDYRAHLAKLSGPVPRIDQVPWVSAYEFAGYTGCMMINTWLQERWESPPGFPIRIVFDHGNQNGRYLATGYSAACKSNPAYGQWGMPPEIAFEKRQTAAPYKQ